MKNTVCRRRRRLRENRDDRADFVWLSQEYDLRLPSWCRLKGFHGSIGHREHLPQQPRAIISPCLEGHVKGSLSEGFPTSPRSLPTGTNRFQHYNHIPGRVPARRQLYNTRLPEPTEINHGRSRTCLARQPS